MSNNLITQKTYLLCYNLDKKVLHYVVADEGQYVTSGQPNMESFFDELEAHKRIVELGFNLQDYLPKKEEYIPKKFKK